VHQKSPILLVDTVITTILLFVLRAPSSTSLYDAVVSYIDGSINQHEWFTSVLFTQKHLHASDCNKVHNTRIDMHVPRT